MSQLDKVVRSYEKPAVEKSIAGIQYFRAEINKSQETLDQKFSGKFLSFDQSYFLRTVGQIVIQYKYEQKYGDLLDIFSGFSGAGFGALQALSCAIGIQTSEFNDWYLGNFGSAISKGVIKKAYEITTSVLLNLDHTRIKERIIEKEIRYLFKSKDINGKRTNRDLTVKECKREVYIPVWDISRRTMTITRSTFPDMPVYLAVCASMLDPIFFETKPIFNGFGIMNGAVTKNNDVYLKQYNPLLQVVSIGAPVRVFNKGVGRIDERSKLIKKDEEAQDIQLDWSRTCGSKRYECTPIDEYFQFANSDKAIQTAQKSGDIEV